MNPKYLLTICITACAILLESATAFACTSVIVSGRVTPDGRPYIFKNRDTGDQNNLVVCVQGKKYRYIAITAQKDTLTHDIWSGHNETGFAIANTAAYNLNGKPKEGETIEERDGTLMRMALETCATLKDFENMIDSLRRHGGPLCVNSNFAVLDAQGGVAYYETGNNGYVKFDANDPMQAPYGYLVRTNHAMTGDRALDKGTERYLAISDYMMRTAFEGSLDFEPIIRNVTRHLTHGLTRQNLWDYAPADDTQPVFFPFRDFIPRNMTASAQLIQGVKKGENPLLTIAWTIAGSPLTTVAIPLWLTPKNELPQVVTRNADSRSTLVDAGMLLKQQLFPRQRGNKGDYINLARLINRSGTGILQQLQPVEAEIFRHAKEAITTLRKNGKAGHESTLFYQWVDQYIREQYQARFGLTL